MPNFNQIGNELKDSGSVHDLIRRKYLEALHDLTGRNVIVYYSGWLQGASPVGGYAIEDQDKTGFMSACHDIDRNLGLDLVLHTPGGDVAATESIVDYLHKMFGDIRVIVPQLAMSGGTMIACAARSILMGKQSSLGPIDPQFRTPFGQFAADAILEEFRHAYEEIKQDPAKAAVWQPIIAKYTPTLIGECQKAIEWSRVMVKNWLMAGMLSGQDDAETTADAIVEELGSHATTLSHARHLSAEKCREIGLTVEMLEDDGNQELQDAVLSVHHACMHTLESMGALKVIENHKGVAHVTSLRQMRLNQ